MRIAMLSDCYLPRLGGIEVQVHDLSQRLVAAGHEVEVFTLTPGGATYRHTEIVDGIRVHRLGVTLPGDLLVNPIATRLLRGRLHGFDVAHLHMGVVSPFAYDAARHVTRLGLPAAMTWHCVLDKAAPVVRAMGLVRRWARGGMAMSAVSEVAAEPLRALTGARVTVLPNGIDAAAWRPTGRPFGDDGVCRIVSAMRLERRKRPVALVEAVARVRAATPGRDVRLEILGEGSERSHVERAVARVGGDGWVSLPGRVSREHLKARYAASDVYVMPSVLESFGIAALEARSAGLPVIARKESGAGEFVVDDVNGYLVGSDAELVQRLTTLVVHPSIRTRMTRHNLDTVPDQDWPAVVRTAEAEYARAITG
ncbi:MAG TPA: glycosyltransferase family 4 protein [Dermatophilaceae bacterium]|nr:glycosyltransferase family 4 protein [Dermatophilaceae bacterium]